MTISLDEHVARAIAKVWAQGSAACARAAIAAVREREGAGIVFTGKIEGTILTVTPDHAPLMVDYELAQSANNSAEAMRAKCEAEMRGMADDCDRLRMWARKDAFLHGADVIAALKGNGEGR